MTSIYRYGGFTLCLLLAIIPTTAADLYQWTDENGVRHYTNTKPPDGTDATVLMEEIPYDPETDDQRRQQEEAMLEEAEQNELLERLEEAERKADEARRQAEAAQRRADRLEKEIEAQEDDPSYGIYYPYPRRRPPGWRPPGHRPPSGSPPAWQPPRPKPYGNAPDNPRRGVPSQGQAK